MSHDHDHTHPHAPGDHAAHKSGHEHKHTCCGRHKHGDAKHAHDHPPVPDDHGHHHDGAHDHHHDDDRLDAGKMKTLLAFLLRHNQDHTNDLRTWIARVERSDATAVLADLKTALDHSTAIDVCLQSAVGKIA